MKGAIIAGGAAVVMALLFYREHGLRVAADAALEIALEANAELVNSSKTLKAEYEKQAAALARANEEIQAEQNRVCDVVQNATAARLNETQDLKNFVKDFDDFAGKLFEEE